MSNGNIGEQSKQRKYVGCPKKKEKFKKIP